MQTGSRCPAGGPGLFGDIDDARANTQNEHILIRSLVQGQEVLYRLARASSREGVAS